MTDRKPPFLMVYRHKGSEYSTILRAPKTWSEAEQHIASIAATGRIEGCNVQAVSVNHLTLPFAAAYAALACWWLNFWRAK